MPNRPPPYVERYPAGATQIDYNWSDLPGDDWRQHLALLVLLIVNTANRRGNQ